MIVPFAAAIQFLLITPAFVRRAFTPTEMGRATALFPVVGALLGAILATLDALLSQSFPVQVRSALVLGVWIILTGALHFDGLLDACDGLLGGETPDRRMEIMRDERTGAFGVAAGGLILLTLFSALSAIEVHRWAALLLAPTLGRCGMSLCIAAFPYARPTGLGRDMKDHAGPAQAVAAVLITAVTVALVAWRTQEWAPAAATAIALIVGGLGSWFVLRRIPGMTGDTYGAINMLIEVSVLLVLAVVS